MPDTAALIARAEAAFAQGQFDYARELLLGAVAGDPDSAPARKRLYAACVRRARQAARSRITATIARGRIHAQLAAAGHPARRAELALLHLADEPADATVRAALAQALDELGHPAGAAAEAEIALSIDATNVEAARVLERARRDLAAKRSMETFDVRDRAGIALRETASHLVTTDAQFDTLVAAAGSPKKVADLYFDRRKDYAQARAWYEKAAALDPHDSALRDRIDDCGLRALDVRIATARQAGDPALASLEAERLALVVRSYERRLADRPTDLPLRYELGRACFDSGDTDKAVAHFQHAVNDPRRKMESHLYLGRCFARKRLFPMADAQFAKAEECGAPSQAQILEIRYERALCARAAGRLDQAFDLLCRVVEVDITFRDAARLLEEWRPPA
jgi:tetratricopeptide (TPR) repeat protein